MQFITFNYAIYYFQLCNLLLSTMQFITFTMQFITFKPLKHQFNS